MKFILPFNQINKNDAALAGGKGASLGEMTQAGIPVPPGFVVLASAFQIFLKATDLNVEIDAILETVNHNEMHTVENASEKIQALILSAQMPVEISKEIEKNFSALGAKFVAVRSSATAEDSSAAAWAGQLNTYLNTTEEDLLMNVQKCWASLFTPRAIFYRFEKGLRKQEISVAVVVQTMIQSEKSGVAFSVHPVTEDYNQLIIEAGYGLGEAIVSGQVTPDSYVVRKDTLEIVDKNISVQTRFLSRAESDLGCPPLPKRRCPDSHRGGGVAEESANTWATVPYSKRNQQKISDPEIVELSKLVCAIEKHYGFPCDIEWALENGKLYITQSRPITTLDNKNLLV